MGRFLIKCRHGQGGKKYSDSNKVMFVSISSFCTSFYIYWQLPSLPVFNNKRTPNSCQRLQSHLIHIKNSHYLYWKEKESFWCHCCQDIFNISRIPGIWYSYSVYTVGMN